MDKKIIKSKIINNEYLSQYIGNYEFVYFENEDQVEKYEQEMCGNKDDNTWMSWVSCKEKFNFPCWIMCYYVPHNLSKNGSSDYTAIYLTKEEAIQDLLNVVCEINTL